MRRLVPLLGCLAVLPFMAPGAAAHPDDPTDTDHDGVRNWADNCPERPNSDQTDTDGDTPRPLVDHPGPRLTGPLRVHPFTEGAGLPTDRPSHVGGDACDTDDDGDGVIDQPAAPASESADTAAPVVRVRLRRRHRVEELGEGLAVGVRCSEACSLRALAFHGGRSVGRGAARLGGPGRTYVFVELRRSWLRAAGRRSVTRATLMIRARDARGNAAQVTRRWELAR